MKMAIMFLGILLCLIKGYSQTYQVTKIDSISNWYVIHINEGNTVKGVILSKKITNNHMTSSAAARLKVGELYSFNLLLHPMGQLDDRTRSQVEFGDDVLYVEGVKVWSLKDDCELYKVDQLRGLFYTQ